MIQTVLFFTMCLMVGEGDDRESDCSYQWFLIEDKETFNLFFEAFSEDTKTPVDYVMGFTVIEPKLVYVRNTDNDFEVLKHEAKHAKCNLNYEGNTRFVCNWLIDRPQLTRGSIVPDYGYVNAIPTPKISDKLAYTLNLLPYGISQEYFNEQQAKNFRNE